MKNILIFLALLGSFGLFAQTKKTGGIKPLRVTVSGKLLQTSSYCGGARPTEQMLEEVQKPIPYPNKVFYVRKGNTNSTKAEVIASFTTNANGEFSFQLTPGKYCIIQEKQLKAVKVSDFKTAEINVDDKCLKEWWTKPYYTLEVKQQNIIIPDFVIHHRCFITDDIPCLSYEGPMPP